MRTLIAAAAAAAITLTPTPAAAAPWPQPVVDAADNMACTHRVSAAAPEGGTGLSCRATNHAGDRQRMLVLRYADAQLGVDFWRWFIDDGGYFARRGHLVIVPMGTKTTPAYTRRWARWAAARVDGKVVTA